MTLSILSGFLLFQALPPNDHWYIAWFALVPLLMALPSTDRRTAFCCGVVTGAVANFLAFSWMLEVMGQYSELGVAAYLVMALMSLYQGLPYALWALFLRSSSLSGRARFLGILGCAISLPVLEYFIPIVFPWYLANTQHSCPELLGPVELGGCGALSLAIAIVNLGIGHLFVRESAEKVNLSGRLWPQVSDRRSRWAMVGLSLVVVLGCRGYSAVRLIEIERQIQESPRFRVAMVQPNQWIEGKSALESLQQYQRMTYEEVQESQAQGQSLDLVVWPESAVRTLAPKYTATYETSAGEDLVRLPLDVKSLVPVLAVPPKDPKDDDAPRWERTAIQRGYRVPVLFGTTLVDRSPGAKGPMPGREPTYNCAVLVDELGVVREVVPKVKLLLFGETIPLASYVPQIYRLLPLASALMPGREAQVLQHRHARLGIMICYEDLLPWFHKELAKKRPQLLVNLTNDAWFGRTGAAHAHLALAKLRAVEGRIYLIRSTTTGVSAVVDASGRVISQLDQDTEGTLLSTVPLLDIETGFERYGDTVVWSGLVLLTIYGFIAWRRFRWDRVSELVEGL